MTWVKICGMTNLEDALVAVDAGADAVGFVFYEKSPRYVSVETAREIVEELPEEVEKIGVFVDPVADPGKASLNVGLTGTQSYLVNQSYYSHEILPATAIGSLLAGRTRFMMAIPMSLFSDPGEIESLVESYAKAIRNAPDGSWMPEAFYDTFVLDSGTAQAPGGTGKAFDWESAASIAEGFRRNGLKLVVAGGLTPENVGNAIRILKPWGVDVASGVEAQPGKKDPAKVRAFVRAVREADKKAS
jgi:phosphoribosylanthranilate isomerase